MEKLTEIAKNGKPLASEKLTAKMKPGRRAKFAPAKPAPRP